MKKIGFVIANHAEDFLSAYFVSDGIIQRSWAVTPELAHRFKTIEEADEAVNSLESGYPLFVLGISENKKRIGIYPPREGEYPKWLFED